MDTPALFAELTDREIAQAVVYEMRRRGLYGCVFFFPHTGGASVFGGASPEGTLADYPAAQQLAIFAELASQAEGGRTTKLSGDTADKPQWIN